MRRAMLALAGVFACAGFARANTVSEHYVGVVSGASTIDTLGMFGPKGADLAGKPIVIYTRYVTSELAQMTKCHAQPRCSFYSSRNAGAAAAGVRQVISVNKMNVACVASRYADVFFRNDGTHVVMTETDVLDGRSATAGSGSQVSVTFDSRVAFGMAMSPGNKPSRSVLDSVSFFTSGSFSPAEKLTFRIRRADTW